MTEQSMRRRGLSEWQLRKARFLFYLFGERRIGIRVFFAHLGAMIALGQAFALFFGQRGIDIYAPLVPVLIFPDVAARMHDSGRSAWWAVVPTSLLAAAQHVDELPFMLHPGAKAGLIFLFVGWGAGALWLLVQSGEVGRNRYGPDPRGDRI